MMQAAARVERLRRLRDRPPPGPATRFSLTALLVGSIVVAGAAAVSPVLNLVLGMGAVVAWPATLATLAAVAALFAMASRGLRERYLWILLGCLPLVPFLTFPIWFEAAAGLLTSLTGEEWKGQFGPSATAGLLVALTAMYLAIPSAALLVRIKRRDERAALARRSGQPFSA